MATAVECQRALLALAARLNEVDEQVRGRVAPDRTLSLRVPDLEVTFGGRLHEGNLVDIVPDGAEPAQVRLECSSDDLIALVEGSLAAPLAWATGRLRIDASPLDLLRLRSLF
ncbi:MAG TPA: hypothetical protein VF288_08390 [Mycobacteriales bacterium]